MSLNSAGQRVAMVAAMHQLRPQGHGTQTEDSLLCLFVCLAACLDAAGEGAGLAEHGRDLL